VAVAEEAEEAAAAAEEVEVEEAPAAAVVAVLPAVAEEAVPRAAAAVVAVLPAAAEEAVVLRAAEAAVPWASLVAAACWSGAQLAPLCEVATRYPGWLPWERYKSLYLAEL